MCVGLCRVQCLCFCTGLIAGLLNWVVPTSRRSYMSQDGVWLILKQLNVHVAAHHQHCLLLCCRWKSWLIPAGIKIFLWALKFFISSDTFMSNQAHGSVLREQLFDAFYNPEFLGSHCTFTSPELQFNTSSLTFCLCVLF